MGVPQNGWFNEIPLDSNENPSIRGFSAGSFGAATRDPLRGRGHLRIFMVISWERIVFLLGNSDLTWLNCETIWVPYSSIFPFIPIHVRRWGMNGVRMGLISHDFLPVVPARGGGGSCLRLTLRPFSSIVLACTMRLPGPCMLALCELVRCCCPRTWPAWDHVAMQHQANSFSTLPTSHCTLHTPHFTLHTCTSHSTLHLISKHLISSYLMSPHLSSSHLFSTCHLSETVFISFEHWESLSQLISTLLHTRKLLLLEQNLLHKKHKAHNAFCAQKFETQMHWHGNILTTYFVLQSLHRVRPSTALYYEACTKVCTTKLAQSTSQHYFLVHTCTKYFPVLLCTTLLAQTMRSTLYNKGCTKHAQVLLCITKLAQSTSQYYFVLQSLHKVCPSTSLY